MNILGASWRTSVCGIIEIAFGVYMLMNGHDPIHLTIGGGLITSGVSSLNTRDNSVSTEQAQAAAKAPVFVEK